MGIFAGNWLVGELLADFEEKKFPTVGEVLRVYYGSFAKKKRDPASKVLNSIAEKPINEWIPKRSVVKKIGALLKKYTQLRKN
jgi:hypothetical protein